MANKYDISGKKLIGLAPDAWVRWAMGISDVVAESVISEEFQWVGRESDVLIKAHSASLGSFLVLIELQLEYLKKMPRRIRAYAGLAEEKYELPVYPVLINLSPAPNTEIVTRYESTFLGLHARQDYRVINLWEVPAEDLLNLHSSPLLPLVPLTKGGDTEEAITRAYLQLQADESLREDERLTELVNLLHIYGTFVTGDEIVAKIMGGDMMNLIREGSAMDQWIKTKQLLEREDHARALALRLLHARFGLIDIAIVSRVNSLSVEQADALSEAVLHFTDASDLPKWLDQATAN